MIEPQEGDNLVALVTHEAEGGTVLRGEVGRFAGYRGLTEVQVAWPDGRWSVVPIAEVRKVEARQHDGRSRDR